VSDPLSDREMRRRLAVLRHVEEVTGNVAMTCRYFGISRQLYYTWLRRYRAEGLEGLRDRSRRPKSCPHATHTEVVENILHLRQNYHFGLTKISMYLKRYHDVAVSSSGVWRILKRLGINRLPASQRYQRRDRKWKRYEKQQPGHRVQIDIRIHRAADQRCDQLRDAVRPAGQVLPVHRDRWLHPAAGAAHLSPAQPKDRDPVRRLRLGPAPIRWRGHPDRQRGRIPVSFPLACAGQGRQPCLHQTRTPRLNGKVERSHRIDAEEFYRLLDGVVIDDTKVFNDKLREWEDYYNYHRPHGALDGQTPYERLRQKTHPSVADLPQSHTPPNRVSSLRTCLTPHSGMYVVDCRVHGQGPPGRNPSINIFNAVTRAPAREPSLDAA
jgi:transposase